MANESESRGSGSMGRESERAERARMKTAYGRESVGHPADTGIRSVNPEGAGGNPGMEPDDGRPSRQTSTAEDMKGQV
jgi:hypothetical protein